MLPFPQDKYQKVYDVPSKLVNVSIANEAEPNSSKGTLLPPVNKPLHRGGKLISFQIEKWGFKDDVAKVKNAPCCN